MHVAPVHAAVDSVATSLTFRLATATTSSAAAAWCATLPKSARSGLGLIHDLITNIIGAQQDNMSVEATKAWPLSCPSPAGIRDVRSKLCLESRAPCAHLQKHQAAKHHVLIHEHGHVKYNVLVACLTCSVSSTTVSAVRPVRVQSRSRKRPATSAPRHMAEQAERFIESIGLANCACSQAFTCVPRSCRASARSRRQCRNPESKETLERDSCPLYATRSRSPSSSASAGQDREHGCHACAAPSCVMRAYVCRTCLQNVFAFYGVSSFTSIRSLHVWT